MTTGNGKDLLSDINVTPFVDVMLVLLIIFMVTAPMMTQGIDVALPESSSESLPVKEEQLFVIIDKESKIFINEYDVELDQLKDKLARILNNRQNKTVYLKADKDISYGMVVQVMSEIKNAGVENLGMVTVPLQKQEPKSKQS